METPEKSTPRPNTAIKQQHCFRVESAESILAYTYQSNPSHSMPLHALRTCLQNLLPPCVDLAVFIENCVQHGLYVA